MVSIGISIGIGIGINITISIGIGIDSFLQSCYCLKLTRTDRQEGRQADGQTCVLGGCALKNCVMYKGTTQNFIKNCIEID